MSAQMELILDCYPCMLRQVLAMAKLTGLNEAQTKRSIDHTLEILLLATSGMSPQHVLIEVIDRIKKDFFPGTGEFDPYGELKKMSNALVESRFEELEGMVRSGASPLETAVKMAAAGNIIDFGAMDHAVLDIEEEIRNIPALKFSRYQFRPLVAFLSNARRLLYIGDNAGEIVFDKLLVRQIKRDFPAVVVTFVTRSEPVINDVTVDDAISVGFDQEAEIVSSGCRYPGLLLTEADEAFGKLWERADIILAKGQGNFEGLSNEDDKRLFFILRVKCERVANTIGSAVGDLVLMRQYETEDDDV